MRVNIIDYILYGGLFLLSLCGAIFCTCFLDLEIGGLVSIWSACVGFAIVAAIVILSKILGGPDWISAQGIQIWTDDIPWFDRTGKQGFNQSIEIFIREVCSTRNVARSSLTEHLSKVNCYWTTRPISLVGWGWEVQDKAGVQQGATIMVEWKGGITKSALIHELMHYVRQKITGLPPDYKHEDVPWWNLESRINEKISRELPYVN